MSGVVITGVGLVTAVGVGAVSVWEGLVAGESGAAPLTSFDPEARGLQSQIACEVETDFQDHDRVDARNHSRFQRFALVAADEAVADAGFDPDTPSWDSEQVGVAIGSGVGGGLEHEETTRETIDGGRVSPRLMVRMLPNLASGHVSIAFDACGPNRAPATACAAGGHAVEQAAREIEAGTADVMIAGGSEASLTPDLVGGFDAMRALSTRNDDPETAMRPFDADRDGFVIGEGAGVVVLEDAEHAAERGAPAYARLTGWGATGDATHPTRPPEDAHGLVGAIETALDRAGAAPDEVDCINAHATSTPAGDEHESEAVGTVFDDPPPVWGPKSLLGHTLGAAGAVDAVLSALAIETGTIPGTPTLETKDDACAVPVPTAPVDVGPSIVVSNAAGFGGTNSALVFEAP